jgi:hypothetical protein
MSPTRKDSPAAPPRCSKTCTNLAEAVRALIRFSWTLEPHHLIKRMGGLAMSVAFGVVRFL